MRLFESSDFQVFAKGLWESVDSARIKDVEELAGHGVSAVLDGKNVYAGNDKLMKRQGIEIEPIEQSER